MNFHFKLLGCAFIILSGVVFSAGQSSRLKLQVREMEILRDFVAFCRREIEYFRSPMPRITEKFDFRELQKYDIGNCIIRGEIPEELNLPNDFELLFSDFLSNIGRNTSEDEIKMCNCVTEQADIILANAKIEIPKKNATCTSLSMLCVVGIAILII